MILSMAHARCDQATSNHVFGIWSDLVVDERPAGLLDCYLLEADGGVQIASIWASAEDHERAIADEMSHPAYVVFNAAGLDPAHTVFKVVGRLG